MTVRRGARAKTAAKPAARKTTKPAARTKTAAKEEVPATSGRDVTQYADKKPTELHKAFARWITEEVGFSPEEMPNKRAAFLMGVSISTAARPAFQGSDFLKEWREENNVTKVGRKAREEEETSRKSNRRNVSDEEFEPEEDETEEESEEEESLEEELSTMAIGPLRKLAKDEYGLSLKAGTTKKEIINAILDAAEEEPEEEDVEDEEGEEEYDLEELQEELEGMTLADLKERAEEEFEITPKKGERKAALIDRILESLEGEEDEEEFDEGDEEDAEEEEEETPPPAKSRAPKGARAGSKAKPAAKSDEDDDEYLF